MPRNVTMAVDLPASPARLYRMYLDPQRHAEFTGAESDFAGVSEGWSKYYWVPWRDYLTRSKRPSVPIA
jgi:hypothetical protein